MKAVKILTIAILIILISIISFFGVYIQEQNRMENVMNDYQYAMDLAGGRVAKYDVVTGTYSQVVDAEGNIVTTEMTDEEITAAGYSKVEIEYNQAEKITLENYEEVKEIYKKRLDDMGVSEYTLGLDEYTGQLVLELPENSETDYIIANLYSRGELEIVDTLTGDVLMTSADLEGVEVLYAQDQTTGSTSVYLDIQFNEEGTTKLEQISNTYVGTISTDTEDAEPIEKTIDLTVDGTILMSTGFDAPLIDGSLQMSIGSAAYDEETLNSNVQQAITIATILDNGQLPLEYELTGNELVYSDIQQETINMIGYVLLAVATIIFIRLMVKYKMLGLLGYVAFVGVMALILLVLRYTDVLISLEGLTAIAMIGVLNITVITCIISKIQKGLVVNESFKEVFKSIFINILPVIIIAVVFSFTEWVPVRSFGMVMFWGLLVSIMYNITITMTLFKIQMGEK